jgi:hypothetical protein
MIERQLSLLEDFEDDDLTWDEWIFALPLDPEGAGSQSRRQDEMTPPQSENIPPIEQRRAA